MNRLLFASLTGYGVLSWGAPASTTNTWSAC